MLLFFALGFSSHGCEAYLMFTYILFLIFLSWGEKEDWRKVLKYVLWSVQHGMKKKLKICVQSKRKLYGAKVKNNIYAGKPKKRNLKTGLQFFWSISSLIYTFYIQYTQRCASKTAVRYQVERFWTFWAYNIYPEVCTKNSSRLSSWTLLDILIDFYNIYPEVSAKNSCPISS